MLSTTPTIALLLASTMTLVNGEGLRTNIGISDPRSVRLKECIPHPHVQYLSMYKEDKIVMEKLYSNPYKCAGTVVEIGAFDGQTFSDSLWFEYAMHWKSLLIEANPRNSPHIVKNRPRAVKYDGAICSNETAYFLPATNRIMGAMQADVSDQHYRKWINKEAEPVPVKCYQMDKIFKKHGIKRVDALFMDVAGSELRTLRTIDFDDVTIDVIVANLDPVHQKEGNAQAARDLLISKGYIIPFSMYDECTELMEEGAICQYKELFVTAEFAARNGFGASSSTGDESE